jgi:hypothetical protein
LRGGFNIPKLVTGSSDSSILSVVVAVAKIGFIIIIIIITLQGTYVSSIAADKYGNVLSKLYEEVCIQLKYFKKVEHEIKLLLSYCYYTNVT